MKINKNIIMEAGGIVAGSVAAGFVQNAIKKFAPNLPAIVPNLAPIVVGVVLASNKKPILRNVGYGMIAKGGEALAASFLPGMGAAPIADVFLETTDQDGNLLNAPADMSIVSAPADMSILSGAGSSSFSDDENEQ